MCGYWVADGEANCSLQTPPAIMQHGGCRPEDFRFVLVPVCCHEFSMPAKNGFGSHDGGEFVEHLTAEDLAFDGEPASLAVVEEYSFLSELFLEYLILSEEVLDGVLLPGLIQPARMRSNKCPG